MSDKYNDIFPTRLRQLIEEKPTTITAVARELGISRQAVSQYTMGIGQPNADKLLQMAEFFDVSVDWLVGRQGGAKSFDMDMEGACRFLGMDEDCVAFLKDLGAFSQKYPNTLHALFTHPKFRESLRSVIKYRWLLENQEQALQKAGDEEARIQWSNAIFFEHFSSTTGMNEMLKEWDIQFRGTNTEVDYREILGMKEEENG
ncbi:helix-turn-helix transcriptional regulator [Oscillospiraceae bacterium 21-37]|uniref:helix-turn-helix domain-containing protein n=1 Tax=Acutalibacter TaxID=1918385 RepID=UPI00272E2E0A|nr:helix-turn-helix transcriptional regulator [Acutalibacter muris]